MKKLIMLLTLTITLTTVDASGQNWNEWMQQKKTQRKYLIKQVALLRTYLGIMKKGVTIVRSGLNTIQNIKNGELNLHRDFFGSLKNVNPHISNGAKVADIIAYQVFILQQLKKLNQYCQDSQQFSAEELRYVADVYTNMLMLCQVNVDELITIIKPDQATMTDDERLTQLNRLHDDMQDKHAFIQSFSEDAQYIATNRAREALNTSQSKAFNTIP